MKNLVKFLSFSIIAVFTLTSCEGPMGPAGVDANESCTLCHNNSAVIETKLAQWDNSVHANGGTASHGNSTGCLQCHTSQGFLQAAATGSTSGLTVPDEPQQINCYTCHQIHKTGTDDDWALTSPGAHVLIVKDAAGADITWDKGSSNQCVSCHQARVISPAPLLDGPDFAVTSSRMGQHHSPVSNLMLGKIAFEIPGSVDYPTSNQHLSANGCITCHMATPYGYLAGGHSWNMMHDETLLTTGCMTTGCHTSSATLATLLTTLQTDIEDKMADLEAQLLSAGILNANGGLVTGTYEANAVIAFINFNTIEEERSEGVHNPGYTKALLDNSIEAMTTAGYPVPAK